MRFVFHRSQVIRAEKPDESKGSESVGIQTVQTVSAEADMRGPRTEFMRSFSPAKSKGDFSSLQNGNDESFESNNLVASEDNVREKNELDDRCAEQFCNVKMPVLSYQNVPVKKSIESKPGIDLEIPFFKNIEIPKLELPNDTVPQFSGVATESSNSIGKPFFNQEIENLGFQFGSGENKNQRFKFHTSPDKLMKDIHNEEKCRPQQNVLNACKDFEPNHEFHIYCHQDKVQYHISEPEKHKNDHTEMKDRYVQHKSNDAESENISSMTDNKQTHSPHHFFERIDDYDKKNLQSKYKTTQCLRQKRKIKSEQHLMLNKKRVQSSEPQISNVRRQSQTPYLKKASSYLSKCSRQVAPDSESTFTYQSLEKRPVFDCDGINFIDFKETGKRTIPHSIDVDKHEHCSKPYERPANKNASLDLDKNKKSPGAEVLEKPTAIPVKTQQLLNKSYWDYYNKLKLDKMENGESAKQQYSCQVAMGAPQSKKRRTPDLIVEESNNTSVELSLPEIRTLEQCSVLSTMINKSL